MNVPLPLARLITAFRRAAARFSLDGCAFLAQSLAFNAVFAMFPLLLITIAALGYLYGSDAGQAKVLGAVSSIAPGFVDIVRQNLASVIATRSFWSVIGIIALWWSSKNFFLGLRYALNRALGITKTRPYLVDVVWSLIAVPMAGALLAVASAAPIIVSLLVHIFGVERLQHTPEVISYLTAFVLVFFVTLFLYSHLPNRRLSLRFGIPGAIFCAFSWAIIQTAYVIYTEHVNFFRIFGAVSAILVLMFWFYLMGIVFLFGGQLCAAMYGDKAEQYHLSRRVRSINPQYRKDPSTQDN
jgi:membrane protein